MVLIFFFFFSSRRRHTRFDCDWSSDVCSSDLGVHSAMPMARAVRLCPGATVVSVPWDACARKSGEIAAVLRRFTPVVEQASSDEFYLDLSGTEQLYGGEPLAATARRMRDAVIAG